MDYERFGKQIALPELGPEGQERLARASVRFVGPDDTAATAEAIWRGAGGSLSADADAPSITVAITPGAQGPCARLGLAAWAAIAAARKALAWGPTTTSPDLIAALDTSERPVE